MCQMTRTINATTQDKLMEWIDQQLDANGWNDAELSKRARISHSVLSKFRAGIRPIGWEACVAIADALHVRPEIVLRLANLLPEAPLDKSDPELDELAYLFQQLPEADRQRILAIARTFQPKKGE